MNETQTVVSISKERRKLIIFCATALAFFAIVLYVVVGTGNSAIAGDVTRVGTVSVAAGLSVIVLSKQGVSGLFGRSYAALTVGLLMWVAAESVWTYTEVVLGQRQPFPSIADAIWIISYGAFGYYMFSLFKFFGKGVKRYKIIIVSVAAAAYAIWAAQTVIATSTVSSYSDMLGVAISIAYPIMDSILFVPAILTVLNAGRGFLTSIPWIFVAWILMGLADTELGIAAVTSYQGDTTYITLTYDASYLCFVGGLVWYLRFFIPSKNVIINK